MKIEKLNSIVMVLFFDLLVACNIGFVKKTNVALKSSFRDLKTKLNQLKKKPLRKVYFLQLLKTIKPALG
ncbi:hypothetical protein [Borreliella americana]|uniref:hypothetical protein n=1 Tax=Borreliella americana TaxID=478807 RepID=UPI001E376B08|nr:hypothetical protein [Borreliella americana]MCD2349292.1 hypothetical protein [Borreliella americana]MCD2382174.1 hypothetical protein [Borreliella americana]